MKIELPDPLPASVAELEELTAKVAKQIRVYQARAEADEEFTPEEADEFEALLNQRDTLVAERDKLATAEEEQAEKISQLLSRAKEPEPEPEPEAKPEPVGEDKGGDTAAAEQAPAAADSAAAAEVVAEAEQVAADAAAQAEQPQPVAASAGTGDQRPVVSFAGATGGQDDLPDPNRGVEQPKGWELLSSAPKFAEFGANGPVGFSEIAKSISSVREGATMAVQRTGTSPDGRHATQAIARLRRPVAGKEVETEEEVLDALKRVGTEIPGHGKVSAQALVAAGGWCAPSEQVYTFCAVPPASNLLSLPDFPVSMNRGGVRFPVNPDVSDLLDKIWHFTESQLEATDQSGNPTAVKQIIELPCPDEFIEYRLEAIGWAAKAGILQRQAWPESIENALEQIQVAHQHRVSQISIQKMVAGSGSPKVIPTDSVLGATSSILNGLALQASNLRYNKGLADDATIEGVAPVWFREVIRADVALREDKDFLAVTDAEIDNWLAVRNIYLQYVIDWQTRTVGYPGHMSTTEYPESVDVLLYPAGTWFRSFNPVITLGVQYPIEQLVLNQYTHIFTEDSLQVGKRCDQSIIVRLPLCVSGAVGARQTVACNATPAGNGGGEGEDGPGGGEGEGEVA